MSQSALPTSLQTFNSTSSTVVKLEEFEPPVILYEPPVNKQIRGVHGEVVLQVRFRIDGSVQILRVIQGLGAAQDAEARRIAQGMRFEPAHTTSGRIVDYDLHLHITFG
jgi:outer membrane biosynthesis protein TonB